MKPRSLASSQTGSRGQDVRQASMTSRYGLALGPIHSRRSRIRASTGSGMVAPPGYSSRSEDSLHEQPLAAERPGGSAAARSAVGWKRKLGSGRRAPLESISNNRLPRLELSGDGDLHDACLTVPHEEPVTRFGALLQLPSILGELCE